MQRPTIMLSGGIGITLLHSMIKAATDKQLAKPIILLYSNTSSADIPFQKDVEMGVGVKKSNLNCLPDINPSICICLTKANYYTLHNQNCSEYPPI